MDREATMKLFMKTLEGLRKFHGEEDTSKVTDTQISAPQRRQLIVELKITPAKIRAILQKHKNVVTSCKRPASPVIFDELRFDYNVRSLSMKPRMVGFPSAVEVAQHVPRGGIAIMELMGVFKGRVNKHESRQLVDQIKALTRRHPTIENWLVLK
jgi:hypothetical protein